MVEEYPILCGEAAIGRAYVARQGLYYRIECRCTGQQKPIRLQVSGYQHTVDLGTCVPMETGFGMVTRIPVKQLGEGKLSFFQQVRKPAPVTEFIPILPNQPLSCLPMLQHTCLELRNGQIGLLFTDRSEGPQGNDPNPGSESK